MSKRKTRTYLDIHNTKTSNNKHRLCYRMSMQHILRGTDTDPLSRLCRETTKEINSH